MASLMPTGKQQFFDSPNGRPLSGGKLYTYAAGTTTPKATYSDAAGTVQNANPIILDSRGEALIYWSGSYDIVLKDANDNLIYSVQNYVTDAAAKVVADFAESSGASLIGWILSASGAVFRWVSDKLSDAVSSKDFGAKGDFDFNTNTGTDDTAAIQAAWNWCAANKRRLKQVGVSKITAPLTYPANGQLEVVGAGAVKTFDSGYAYRGTGTMLTGTGADKTLAFCNFKSLVFDGPGIGSGVNGLYGDFYQGGAQGCIFRNWNEAVKCFGSINSFKDNRFLTNVSGLTVTNWPAGSSQAGVPTTTFLSKRNNFFGNTGFGLKLDTSGTGGDNIVSSASVDDVFEQNGVGLYLNKSFSFLIENIHTELHTTWAIQSISSDPTLIQPYIGSGDGAKLSFTFPGASANAAGYNKLDYNGLLTRGIHLQTKNGIASLTANDAGGIDLAGAGLVGTWTPRIGATSGTISGNAYSLQEGNYIRLGKLVIATFRLVMTAKDSGMGGVITIGPLPFQADPAFSNAYANPIRYTNVFFSGGAYVEMLCDVSGYEAQPAKFAPSLAAANVVPGDIAANTALSGTIIYMAV